MTINDELVAALEAALKFLNAEYHSAYAEALEGDPLSKEARPLRNQIVAALSRAKAGGGELGYVYVEVSGLTGSGKSAVMGEIEIALRALGLTVRHDAEFQAEKNGTHADWQAALDLYKPTIVIRERNVPRLAALQQEPT